jgi:hypothetical protein
MPTIRPLRTLFSLSILLIAGLLLTACGDDVDVSPAGAATATASGTPAAPAAPPAAPSAPAAPITLAGTPASSVTVGQSYVFQPTVSAGASKVTFQIQGKPSWATFNASTGALSGTPAAANAGTSAGISITATNGSSSASIGPFAIVVKAAPAAPTTGSATLSWTEPTENTDGTPVTDLAGYHIYYGTTEGAWTSTITVLEATETSYVVSGLAPGTYYFAVVAFNSAGDDSPESNVGSKTI